MDDKSSLRKKAQFWYTRAKRQFKEGKYEEAIKSLTGIIELAQALGDTKNTGKGVWG